METFAERQLKKFGWKKGDSLGKSQNGLTRAIVPEVKQDLLGIGSSVVGDCWWDHQYNKATAEIQIVVEDGVTSVVKNESKASAETLFNGSFLKSSGSVEKNYEIKITDEQLFEACGRRSCRKGARGVHRDEPSATITQNTPPDAVELEKEAKKALKKAAKKTAKKEAKKTAKRVAKKAKSAV